LVLITSAENLELLMLHVELELELRQK